MSNPSAVRVLEPSDHVEHMEDDGRPPEGIPVMSRVWVEKVQSSIGGGIPSPETVLEDEFAKTRMRVEFPNGAKGEPVITIGKEVLEVMYGLYRNCMIVKVLGRHITIDALNRKLKEMWKPRGGMAVLDLPRQFFMIRFDLEEDYMAAVTGGPWRVFGSILMVKAWSPDFDPVRDDIVTTPVWVRISNLPVFYYHRKILMGIAEGVGKPLRVDLTTLKMERGRFARICVEVNLRESLKGTVLINDERYYVSYEGLTNICPTCGVYGHNASSCPTRVLSQSVGPRQALGNKSARDGEKEADGFTEVRRTHRRGDGPHVVFQAGGLKERAVENRMEVVKPGEKEVLKTSNMFNGLAREEGEHVDEQMDGSSESNKENVSLNSLNQRKNTNSGKEKSTISKAAGSKEVSERKH
ncbi:hypothetical protein CARUB_v10028495mg, partial [Capsella rubella]